MTDYQHLAGAERILQLIQQLEGGIAITKPAVTGSVPVDEKALFEVAELKEKVRLLEQERNQVRKQLSKVIKFVEELPTA